MRFQKEQEDFQLWLQNIGSGRGTNRSMEGEVAVDPSTALEGCSPYRLIPRFNEKRDDLDAYLKWFDQIAVGQKWSTEK